MEKKLDRPEMNQEDLESFLKGLRRYMKQNRLRQGNVAKRAGTTGITMSKYLNRRGDPSESWRDSVTAALGVSENDLVLLGKKTDIQAVDSQHSIAKERTEQGSYLDVMTSIGRLVSATQKTEDRLRFWKEMFGMLPVPALIIREGSVIYQNELSIVMGGDISGKDICALCIGGGCESKGDCPAHIANKNTNPTTGYRTIRGIRYKISVSHVRLNEMNYFIVLITSVRDEEV